MVGGYHRGFVDKLDEHAFAQLLEGDEAISVVAHVVRGSRVGYPRRCGVG